MRQRLAWLAAIGALLAGACAPQTAATPDSSTATSVPLPLPTEAIGPDAPTATPNTPTREQVVQVQPTDWVRGPENAAVTFIEWGDFQ